MPTVVSVRFKKACKVYSFACNGVEVKDGDAVIVETDRGMALGTVASNPVEKREREVRRSLKRVIRVAGEDDLERLEFNREREDEAFRICKEKIARYRLPMKLINVEYLFDSSKAIFYFLSESRIDFRELVKNLATEFHTRIEMKQVGVRDETKLLGGIGPCGRQLCCSTFLTEFAPVTVKMAREQNVTLNPAKISGVCGRLMCCLTYEHSKGRRGGSGRPCRGRNSSAPAAKGGGEVHG
ncbi:MAG: stage 0 sporulation family protein [Thermodesulfobacteriota bacterium]